jgi:hypothetical protein
MAALIGLAWLLMAAQLLAQYWPSTATTLPDADDAMRLVQVRDFLAGHGWFDLHNARLNPPSGYDSHWSRLIDAGLAGLFVLFHLFADAPLAERLMLAVWPVLWLLPCAGAVAALAWRMGGREAAMVVLLLAAFAIPGFQQFLPGRIDHHNVHIALTLLTVAAAAWSDRLRWCAWAAGALTGLAVAIGLEALPFYALIGVAFALRFIVDPSAASAMRAYAAGLTLSSLAAFFVTVGPDRWTLSVCDMIAINSASALIVAALGLIATAQATHSAGWRGRSLGVVASAGAALAVFTMFEPRCLAGPFGLIDPAIRPIWLDNVSEVAPLSHIYRQAPLTGLATASFPLAALLALIAVGADRAQRRDFGFLLVAATFLLSVIGMVAAIRVYSYAIWLGLPFVAVAMPRVLARLRLNGIVPRFFTALLLTPTAITLGTIVIGQAAGIGGLLELNSTERQACVRRSSYTPLAALPQGLVAVSALEWAPYLLAWTPQPLLAAPYHRMSQAIMSWHRIFASPPDEARSAIDQNHVAYVAMCGQHAPEGVSEEQLAASLWARLRAGAIPDWLERLPQSSDTAFAIYRVKS